MSLYQAKWLYGHRVLIILGLIFLGYLGWIWIEPGLAQGPSDPPAGTDQPGTDPAVVLELRALKAEIASERKQLESERDRLAALDNTSRVLLTVSGVFAVLLGLGAWKTLDDQRRSATENLDFQMKSFEQRFNAAIEGHNRKADDALNDIDRLRDELQQDFPMFGRMRRNFTRILQSLQSACQDLTPSDDAFSKLDWEQKEEILFFERAIADTLLLDMQEHADQLSEIYRLLGVFYGSRYTSELGNSATPPARDFLDRSQFYFSRAIEISGQKSYLAYSHAGHFCMLYKDAALSKRAKQFLVGASLCGPTKQKPLVNLAILELAAFHNPTAAIKSLSEAERRSEWEKPGSSPKAHVVAYIKACALASRADEIAETTERDAFYESALVSLESAAASADDWMRSAFVEGDYQSPPDRENYFKQLAGLESFAGRYRSAAARIEDESRPGAAISELATFF